MEYFPLIIIIFGLFLLFRKLLNKKEIQTDSPPANLAKGPSDENIAAREAIQRVIDTCRKTGGDGFDALIITAAGDGKVSRDELRIIAWYCSRFGARFDSSDLEQIDRLNTGVAMNVKSETTPEKIITELEARDSAELVRLYAAIAAIGKPWGRSSQRIADAMAAIEARLAAR
jgi:hypothetical protein